MRKQLDHSWVMACGTLGIQKNSIHMGYDCYEIVVTVVHEATSDETWPALQVMLLAEPLLNSLGMEWVKTLWNGRIKTQHLWCGWSCSLPVLWCYLVCTRVCGTWSTNGTASQLHGLQEIRTTSTTRKKLWFDFCWTTSCLLACQCGSSIPFTLRYWQRFHSGRSFQLRFVSQYWHCVTPSGFSSTWCSKRGWKEKALAFS